MSLGADLCMGAAALVLAYFLNPWNLMEMSIILANKEKVRDETSVLGPFEPFATCRVDQCNREVMFNSHFCHGHVEYHNNPSEYLATLNEGDDPPLMGEDSVIGTEWWNQAGE